MTPENMIVIDFVVAFLDIGFAVYLRNSRVSIFFWVAAGYLLSLVALQLMSLL